MNWPPPGREKSRAVQRNALPNDVVQPGAPASSAAGSLPLSRQHSTGQAAWGLHSQACQVPALSGPCLTSYGLPAAEATKPEDWDDDEDGEWEPPKIPNPKCKDVSPACPASMPLHVNSTPLGGPPDAALAARCHSRRAACAPVQRAAFASCCPVRAGLLTCVASALPAPQAGCGEWKRPTKVRRQAERCRSIEGIFPRRCRHRRRRRPAQPLPRLPGRAA